MEPFWQRCFEWAELEYFAGAWTGSGALGELLLLEEGSCGETDCLRSCEGGTGLG
jgi:hypothetical protein